MIAVYLETRDGKIKKSSLEALSEAKRRAGDMGIEALYNHEFAIARPTRTADGQGGWALGYADAGTVLGRPSSAHSRSPAAVAPARARPTGPPR